MHSIEWAQQETGRGACRVVTSGYVLPHCGFINNIIPSLIKTCENKHACLLTFYGYGSHIHTENCRYLRDDDANIASI